MSITYCHNCNKNIVVPFNDYVFDIRDFIRSKMNIMEINQSQLAKLFGVSKVVVSTFLSGTDPHAISVNLIFDKLGIPEYLTGSTYKEVYLHNEHNLLS